MGPVIVSSLTEKNTALSWNSELPATIAAGHSEAVVQVDSYRVEPFIKALGTEHCEPS